MHIDLFDFHLPEENIALRPCKPRDHARLLVVKPQEKQSLSDHHVYDLPSFLTSKDMLVFNDTRVVPAELHGIRFRGQSSVKIRLNLIKRLGASCWAALVKPKKRLKISDEIIFNLEHKPHLKAIVKEFPEDGSVILDFVAMKEDNSPLSYDALDGMIAEIGAIPLPPYIGGKRAADEADKNDYQTIYAKEKGAVAAPTAGLHFTPDLMAALEKTGVASEFITLHVGAGTFLPVKVDNTKDHKMHSEWGHIDEAQAERINSVKKNGGRIIAVGTTSLRLLESAANEEGRIQPFEGETDIFIKPAYRFKCVDMLMTNFHLPKSTLFMLVSALSGLEIMRKAYEHAIEKNYRFYSYGDSSLLYLQETT